MLISVVTISNYSDIYNGKRDILCISYRRYRKEFHLNCIANFVVIRIFEKLHSHFHFIIINLTVP